MNYFQELIYNGCQPINFDLIRGFRLLFNLQKNSLASMIFALAKVNSCLDLIFSQLSFRAGLK